MTIKNNLKIVRNKFMERQNEYCMICNKELDYVVEYCCGFPNPECGCRGLPVEPPVCSNECYDIVMKIERGENE